MSRLGITSLAVSWLWSAGAFASASAPAESSSGLPQFDPSTFAPQLFWLTVTFVILYLIMSKMALPRVGEILRNREERIADDLDRAESLNREAEEALGAYEQSLADARAKANEIAAETRGRIQAETEARQAEAEAKLAARADEAEQQITAARNEAMSNVQEIASGAAAAVVTKLLGSSPDAGQVSGAVDAELDSRRGK